MTRSLYPENISKEIPLDSTSEEAHALMNAPPKVEHSKDLLQVYTDFVEWVINATGFLAIRCRRWAVPEERPMLQIYPPLVKLPSWISKVTESPFCKQEEGFNGRRNEDRVVGTPDRRCYNASHGKLAEARFGADLQSSTTRTTLEPVQQHNVSRTTGPPAIKKARDPCTSKVS